MSNGTPVKKAPIHSKSALSSKDLTFSLRKNICSMLIVNIAPPSVMQKLPTYVKIVLNAEPVEYRKFEPKNGTKIAIKSNIPIKTKKVLFDFLLFWTITI